MKRWPLSILISAFRGAFTKSSILILYNQLIILPRLIICAFDDIRFFIYKSYIGIVMIRIRQEQYHEHKS